MDGGVSWSRDLVMFVQSRSEDFDLPTSIRCVGTLVLRERSRYRRYDDPLVRCSGDSRWRGDEGIQKIRKRIEEF